MKVWAILMLIVLISLAGVIALASDKIYASPEEFLNDPANHIPEEPAAESSQTVGDGSALQTWLNFYQTYFPELRVHESDLAAITIPASETEFEELVIIPKGLTPEQTWRACRKQYRDSGKFIYFHILDCPSITAYGSDLDSIFLSIRSSSQNGYALRLANQPRIYPHQEIMNEDKPINTLTLMEGLIYFMFENRPASQPPKMKIVCAGSIIQKDGNLKGWSPTISWTGNNLLINESLPADWNIIPVLASAR